MHLNDFEGLSIDFARECELFELAEASAKPKKLSHIFGTLVTFILLKQLIVVIHVINIEIAIGAY